MKVSFSEIKEMKSFLMKNGEPEVIMGYIIVRYNQL